MLAFPNSKINLGLHVIGKRTDGYHDLETVFYPIAIKDALEVIRSTEFLFQLTGLPVNDTNDNNICIKAYHLIKKKIADLPPVQIHLHKVIPTGAGLGGGSADGAFMLTMLNKKFQLKLTHEELIDYALQLGSDCPFFIINKPCFAASRGENLSPVQLDLSVYKMVLVNPGIHVSTKEAFSALAPTVPVKSIFEIIQQPITTWKDELKNDFENSVFQLHPTIKEIKDHLYNSGAVYAAMSGSGSTVFGIFKADATTDFSFPDHYKCFTVPATD